MSATASIAPIRAGRLARSPLLRDLAPATIAFGLTLAVLAADRGSARELDALGVVLAGLACFPLLARRRSPLGVFAATACASAVLGGLGYALGPPFGPTIALFFVAADDRTHGRIRRTAAVVLGLFALHVAATAAGQEGFPTSPILFGVVVWGGAWVIGDQVRQRRRRHAELVERARRLERDMQRERRLAAAEERTRIARDLHDSAAHAINVILVQAGAARLLQERDPEAVRGAISTIEDVARETIAEIDQLVRALREGDDGRPSEAIEPPAGLAALETLVGRHRSAGLDVDLRIAGRRRALAPGVDQAAYRILQEALTNAARHGTGSAAIEIVFAERGLDLEVSNPTEPGTAAENGHGILGMRERAALLGGELHTMRGNGRFHVRAVLPYAEERL